MNDPQIYMSYDVSRKIANSTYRTTVNIAIDVAKMKPECFIHTNATTGNRYAVIPTRKYTFIVEKANNGDYFVKES